MDSFNVAIPSQDENSPCYVVGYETLQPVGTLYSFVQHASSAIGEIGSDAYRIRTVCSCPP